MLALVGLVITSLSVLTLNPAATAEDDESSIAHLPEVVQRDIGRWRQRLEGARCLKVVCETDESWVNLHELDEEGVPRVVLRERYEIHSWMTPRTLWMVAFAYDGDRVATERPIFQQFWSGEVGMVWERTWMRESDSYQVRRYECDEPFGPTQPRFGAHGCSFATVMESWLAGPPELAGRTVTVSSVALLRGPSLALVTPETPERGVWLDVFRDTFKRDEDPDPRSVYWRHDMMLLARDSAGEPEVREWRTIAVNDADSGGREPQRMTAIRRLSYAFYESVPDKLGAVTRTFAGDVERAIAK